MTSESFYKQARTIILVMDSSVIKVVNSGEWIRHKWHKRRGFLKICVGVDVDFKKILDHTITDEHSHDTKHLSDLIEQVYTHRKMSKVRADPAYDPGDNFS